MAHGSQGAEAGSDPVDPDDLDALFSLTYEELRRLASSVRAGDAGLTLSPTALVNEAWIKLASSPPVEVLSRLHFKRLAARAMRQVLVEAARRRQTDKRGGGLAAVVFDDALHVPATGADELLVLDAALEQLARMSPRQASVVESRFFGGLEEHEVAQLLGVSEATVQRDWKVAKAWLSRELRRAE